MLRPRRALLLLAQANNVVVAFATTVGAGSIPAAAFAPHHRWQRHRTARSSRSGPAIEGARDADPPHGSARRAAHAAKRKGKKKTFVVNPIGTGTVRSDGRLADKKRAREARKAAAPACESNLGVPSKDMPQLQTDRRRDGGSRRSNRRNNRGPRSNDNHSNRRRRRSRTPPPPMPPPGAPGGACFRDRVPVGTDVFVVKKEDQRTGRETAGRVSRRLTNAAYHPRGIKVLLSSGVVGRVTRFAGGGRTTGEEGREARAPSPLPGVPAPTEGPPGDAGACRAAAGLFVVDEGALARLVGEMEFDTPRAREALEMHNNDLQRAVHHLLQQG